MTSAASSSRHSGASTAEVTRSTSVDHFLEPLRAVLEEESVTEVCVNRPHEIFFERAGRWEQRAAPTLDFAHLNALATAVAKYANDHIGESKPVLSAILPRGERAQIVIPKACEPDTVSVTIRKPSFAVRRLDQYAKEGFFDRIRPPSDDGGLGNAELLQLKASGKYVEFLRRAVQLEKVIVVAGPTGSGKTTFMRALAEEIPRHSRIITIEDSHELFLRDHPNRVHLFYPSEASEDDKSPVTPATLLKSTLRMYPNRIILSELRGAEAFDFLNVAASGHEGSLTSMHGGNVELSFERMALMVLQNRQGRMLPYEVIRRLLYLVVDVVVQVHNDAGQLHGRSISELWFDPSKKRRDAPLDLYRGN